MGDPMAGGIWRQVVEGIDEGSVEGVVELAQAPTPVAQAGVGESIGKVETTKGGAFVTRTDGTKVKAEVGLEIFQGDVIETEGKGSIGIVFADNSTFSLAEAGQMTIDEMVYDPGTQEGSGAFSVATGVFTFVSGQIAKTGVDAMLINTPTSTIGIRGTSLAAKIGSKKGDVFTLLEDQDAPAPAKGAEGVIKGQAGIDQLLAQAGTPPPAGEITITNDVGSQTLNQPNATSSVSSRFSSPTIPWCCPPRWSTRCSAPPSPWSGRPFRRRPAATNRTTTRAAIRGRAKAARKPRPRPRPAPIRAAKPNRNRKPTRLPPRPSSKRWPPAATSPRPLPPPPTPPPRRTCKPPWRRTPMPSALRRPSNPPATPSSAIPSAAWTERPRTRQKPERAADRLLAALTVIRNRGLPYHLRRCRRFGLLWGPGPFRPGRRGNR